MSELVGAFAVSHTPVMVTLRDDPPAEMRDDVMAAFAEIGRQITAAEADVVVVVSDDHLHNFFLDNLPAFCIGVSDSYPAPVERWLPIEQHDLTGDRALAAHLLAESMEQGFDPSLSLRLKLDHGTVVPLYLAGLLGVHRIVPVHVNTVQPPMPSFGRCLAFGRALGTAIASHPQSLRVAVLATGGLSHDVGTPRMGMLNEEFDRTFLELFEGDDDDALVEHLTTTVDAAGNGAEETRNWLVARGIAGGASFVTSLYRPVDQWYTGIALGQWAST